MTRRYVVQCVYPLYFAAAVRKAGEDGLWANTDIAGEPFAWKIHEDVTFLPWTPRTPGDVAA